MIEQLLKYQEKDEALRKIELELSGSEEWKKAVEARSFIKHVDENIAKLESIATELSASYDNALKKRDSLLEQEKEFESAVKEVSDLNEGNYILKKIDELVAAVKNLSKEISELSSEMQKVLKDYKDLKEKTKQMQTQFAEYGKKYKELASGKEGEKTKIQTELDKIKKGIPAELMELYDKKRKEKMFPILYKLTGDDKSGYYCGRCGTALPMNDLQRLKNGEIIECDNCRSLLYK